jgi:hypothetical protein
MEIFLYSDDENESRNHSPLIKNSLPKSDSFDQFMKMNMKLQHLEIPPVDNEYYCNKRVLIMNGDFKDEEGIILYQIPKKSFCSFNEYKIRIVDREDVIIGYYYEDFSDEIQKTGKYIYQNVFQFVDYNRTSPTSISEERETFHSEIELITL